MAQRREIRFKYIYVNEKKTGVLMKSFLRDKLVYFREKLGLVEITLLIERECYFFRSMDGYPPKMENGSNRTRGINK